MGNVMKELILALKNSDINVLGPSLLKIYNLSAQIEHRESIEKQSGLEALITLLKHTDNQIRWVALKTLGTMAWDESKRDKIRNLGGIESIISCLHHVDQPMQIEALLALYNLSVNNVINQKLIGKGSIPRIVELLSVNNTIIQMKSALLLSKLGMEANNHVLIIESEGVKKLICLLNDSIKELTIDLSNSRNKQTEYSPIIHVVIMALNNVATTEDGRLLIGLLDGILPIIQLLGNTALQNHEIINVILTALLTFSASPSNRQIISAFKDDINHFNAFNTNQVTTALLERLFYQLENEGRTEPHAVDKIYVRGPLDKLVPQFNSLESNPNIPETLPDNNCAFNCLVLFIRDIFLREPKSNFLSEFSSFKNIQKHIKMDPAQLQRIVAPLLRNLFVKEMSQSEEQRILFGERLVMVIEYKLNNPKCPNIPDTDTFLVHDFIVKKIDELLSAHYHNPATIKALLTHWWQQEGYVYYLNTMLQGGRMSTWGSSLELDILGKYLKFPIRLTKDGHGYEYLGDTRAKNSICHLLLEANHWSYLGLNSKYFSDKLNDQGLFKTLHIASQEGQHNLRESIPGPFNK
jgi:hypothetical protein